MKTLTLKVVNSTMSPTFLSIRASGKAEIKESITETFDLGDEVVMIKKEDYEKLSKGCKCANKN